MDALDTYIPDAEARGGQAVPDAHRRRVLDQGPRHGGHRPYRARQVKVGDEVEIVGLMKAPKKTVVTGVEMFNKTLEFGMAGDNVGVLLRGIERDDIERGQVLAKPGSITPHTKFEANVYVLTQGRRRPAHAVLRRLSAAVLLPHHRRHRLGHRTDRRRRQQGGNVHARRQHQGQGGADARFARSPWTKTCASPSAKAAAPSAPAW